MKVGIISSTFFEIQPTINFLSQQQRTYPLHEFHVCVTGIGSLLTSYHLTKFVQKHKPDYMLQAGVAGSFIDKFQRGDVLMVRDELLGDLGAHDTETFNDIFDLGLMDVSADVFHNKRLVNPHITEWIRHGLPIARGLTVNQISTDPKFIERLVVKYGCEIESLEGAAFHFVCLHEQVPFLQLRAVSNVVGERNKKNWRIKEAVQNLNDKLITLIKELP
jgi:futalosine hydrolase